jgi:hypothetical protein
VVPETPKPDRPPSAILSQPPSQLMSVSMQSAPASAGRDPAAMFEVGRKDTMETGEVQTWPRHQRRQPGDEIQRLQHHVGRPIPERLFVLVHDPAPAIDGQPLGGNRQAGDVSAQAFQAASLIRFTDGGGVQ